MNDNFLQDIGENYEYVRTIVNNTVELKKIEAAEITSEVLGRFVLGMVAAVVSFIVLIGLTIISAIWLTTVIGSVILAILILCLFFIIILLMLYFLRERLLYAPCRAFIYSLLTFEK